MLKNKPYYYTPIDTDYINEELKRFFENIPRGVHNYKLTKYKQRFLDEVVRKKRTKIRLSTGKKLEILCVYAGHKIIKIK